MTTNVVSAVILIVLLWPHSLVNLTSLLVVSTACFHCGSIREDKLIEESGDAHRCCQQVVPQLIPRPGREYRLAEWSPSINQASHRPLRILLNYLRKELVEFSF